ncbi:hypothetical protein HPT25_02370 [Bacillus sp. BRMEA1]|uniref:hypothetical protein n=1 Tax=Neobacillus endophyticus TaxID=2738405 RepID=UPI0015656D0A|nr:hypothetical protein [Neobacillus endophyticus]NRD76331.1 hypothetical protein [Neobacillus endophyticus]
MNGNQTWNSRFQTANDQLQYLNKWLIIFMCIWVIWPYINYKAGIYPFFALTAVWLLTLDYRWILKGWSLDMILFIIWILTFVPYLVTGNFHYGTMDEKNVLTAFVLFNFGIFINHYYMYFDKNEVVLGRMVLFSMLFYFIGAIQTYLGLKKYPLAARELATGNGLLQDTYVSLGIGGFGFVYSALILNILLLYFVIKKTAEVQKIYKWICFVCFAMISMMLITASYTTSLLLLFIGIIFVLFIKGKLGIISSVILLILFFLLFSSQVIGYFLINAAHLFENNQVINSKLLDLAQGFVGGGVGSQTSGRGHLYLASLETFLKNPLFGIYGPFNNSLNSEVGGHSGWFDLMAYYGLFGSLPLFGVIFLQFKKQLKYYSNHPYQQVILAAQIIFIVLGFINPVTYIYQIGFVLFAIAPALPFLPYAFQGTLPERE